MLVTHPNQFIKGVYPSLVWKKETDKKEIYLTFDDGPTPGVTDRLLDLLLEYKAKSTFFLLGKNMVKYPELFNRILAEGHTVGNHTYDHMNGWRSSTLRYMRSVEKFEKLYQSNLFRPPYGRLKPSQIIKIKENYDIIMWSALSMDYHPNISKERCFKLAMKNIKSGSIVVFHDSKKASSKMLYTVERMLKSKELDDYTFERLTNRLELTN